jgi:endonuclease/exonuclease/phosphatase family metal-dependent hydrolase
LSLTVAGGIGMTILGILILGYSPAVRTALPFDNAIFIMLAALLVAGGAMTSLRYARPRLRIGVRPWLAGAAISVIILALPLSQSISSAKPQTADAGFPLRVLSLNLHNGFDAKGRLDLEGLAVEIERSGADIIALQEVSRGWLETGRSDTLAWLSDRLDMDFYFGPTDGPLWGNAILSRYPIISAASFGLPSEGLQFRRGLIAAVIEVGGQNLQVINLHLHHVAEDSVVRVNQVLALADLWDSRERTVIMGDFNAEPSSTEIGLVRGIGLIDVIASIEPPPAYTYHSEFPYQRTDYMWVSTDLSYSDVGLLTGTASDHFGVMATIAE